MKNISIFAAMVTLIGVISFSPQAFAQSNSKVLMFLREGEFGDLDLMLKMEVGTMTMLLTKAGFKLDAATYSGQPIAGKYEKTEKVMKLSEIKLDDYQAIIIPCLNTRKGGVVPEAVELVKKAVADGKPVAAPLSSVTILAEAGLLRGRKYAFIQKTSDPRFADAIYSGSGVVQDGKIITSGGCPASERYLGVQNRTFELTQTFIKAIGTK